MEEGDDLWQLSQRLEQLEAQEVTQRLECIEDVLAILNDIADRSTYVPVRQLVALDTLRQRLAAVTAPLVGPLWGMCQARWASYSRDYDLDTRRRQLVDMRRQTEWVVKLSNAANPGGAQTRQAQEQASEIFLEIEAVDRAARLEKLLQETVRRLKEATEADKLNATRCLTLLREARTALDGALREEGVAWTTAERTQIQIKADEVYRLIEDAAKRHEWGTTMTDGGQLVAVIHYYAALPSEAPVSYFEDAQEGAVSKPTTANAALEIARQRLVNLFWHGKVRDYCTEATRLLDEEHRPDLAQSMLNRWKDLPGRYDKSLGVDFPEEFGNEIGELQARITPALNGWRSAQHALREAESEEDPLRAAQQVTAALKAYSYVDVANLWSVIAKSARLALRPCLNQAEKALREASFRSCDRALQRAQELLALTHPVLDEEAQRCSTLRQVCDVALPLEVGRAAARLSGSERLALLTGLRETYEADYWPGWTTLQDELTRLQRQANLNDLIERVSEICQLTTPASLLEELKGTADDLLKNQALSDESRGQLRRARARLEAWIGLARAGESLGLTGTRRTVSSDLNSIRKFLDATNRDPSASQAARDQDMWGKLHELEAQAKAAEGVLQSARALVTTQAEMSALRGCLSDVRKWLVQPTQVYRELLEIRPQLERKLIERIQVEANRLLCNEAQLFDGVEGSKLKQWQADLAACEEQSDARTDLEERIGGVLLILDAQQRARAAAVGDVSWEDVMRTWEKAALHYATGTTLYQACNRRAKQAYKQRMFADARTRPADAAETLLRALCVDPVLSLEWDVWFEHAEHCLRSAQALLRSLAFIDGQSGHTATYYLDGARASLENASKRAQASDGPADAYTRTHTTIEEVHRWAALNRVGLQIVDSLRSSIPPASQTCLAVVEQQRKAAAMLSSSEPGLLLTKHWDQECNAIRPTLTELIGLDSASIGARVDAALALVILFPNDPAPGVQLGQLLSTAFRQLETDVHSVCDDYSGANARVQTMSAAAAQTVAPALARHQLEKAQSLVNEADKLQELVSVVSKFLPNKDIGVKISIGPLLEQAQNWRSELQAFQNSVNQALNLARAGLIEPGQFKAAYYILLEDDGLAVYTYDRIDARFRSHPSFAWCRREVAELERRRKRQEYLRQRLLLTLKYETATRVEELPMTDVDPTARMLFDELRNGLASGTAIQYPIEFAVRFCEIMVDKEAGEPEDACGLQETLEYVDPDTRQMYRSLAQMAPVLKSKQDIVRWFMGWVRRFEALRAEINWSGLRANLERERDSGPDGLSQAYSQCEGISVRLDKAILGLTAEAMRTALGLQKDAELPQVVQRLDAERRETLLSAFKTDKQACSDFQADVRRRAADFPLAWQTFLVNADAVLARPGRGVGGKGWSDFQRECRRFWKICPAYPHFDQKLKAVEAKTKLNREQLLIDQ